MIVFRSAALVVEGEHDLAEIVRIVEDAEALGADGCVLADAAGVIDIDFELEPRKRGIDLRDRSGTGGD